ncbi:sn-glycerol-1-phosphate dehydrogenase [Lederbergia lenta]|uniref:AraM n=1 Tax=Lederbergia lenta TaxID=1467 RepID=A0A2X4ZP08_LEDLE|nr:sn-glycerol-1-phosphate dehydrogenase [Lederbergia lenta]MCM3111824.1 sn-glycerol-1-phosphate dehydrogenase [Lederbergia lenta]MEC2322978.1 sn-glycerol-1-phosphate dehydrogenase [Lederbergia lenta]SQI62144.1 AraM [Lederbergia lenta]
MKLEEMISEIELAAKDCECGNAHNKITIETMTVGDDAFEKCAAFIVMKKYKRVLMIADVRTYAAAGEKLHSIFVEKEIEHAICLIEPNVNGDVVADEVSIVQAMLELDADVDAIIAVGSGTIHDIARFCGAKTSKPFISIPTAASVDGFTSLGAPIIVRGMKKTFQTVSPIALFADINVLINAPKEMTAAGFGDMLAKFTSLADWNFGHLHAGEPFCRLSASITEEALRDCVEKIEQIATGEEEGIGSLITALIQSGLAMLIFGQSHPASGGEHHLSHYWEMEFLQKNQPQVLHGAKVGVSSIILAKLYKQWFGSESNIPEGLKERAAKVAAIVENIPDADRLKSWLEKVSGPTTPLELGISSELVERSLKEAYLLRDRSTMLKYFNVEMR